MSTKETLDKAYGSIPKECQITIDTAWLPTFRGIKYYWLKLIRSITR